MCYLCFRAFKVIYSCAAHQNTTFGTKFVSVGPCSQKLWPERLKFAIHALNSTPKRPVINHKMGLMVF